MRRWGRDLALGLRLALSGGSGPRWRAVLTAVGVGVGVALLLAATALPNAVDAREDRLDARAPVFVKRTADAPLIGMPAITSFRASRVTGLVVQQQRRGAPTLAGLPRLPRPGEMYVSPALRDLLAEPGSGLLRERLPARVAGVIGDAALEGPAELVYVAGSDALRDDPRARGIARFGATLPRMELGPLFTLLVIVMVVALLLPVGVFVATAVRFGGEDRDRRLAALRLAGADRAATARIAAGETLLGALAGLGAGALLFALGRPFAEHVRISGIAVFAHDLEPSAGIAALVVVLVPLAAIVATLATLRGVAIEPLGVARHARPPRRRLWWRLVPTALGLLLLWPFISNISLLEGSGAEYQAAGGVLLILGGTAALLPWLVDAVVHRAPSGPLPWQLAVRRLQLDGGTSGRVVGAIAVAVAGAIALQTIFSAATEQTTRATGVDTSEVNMTAALQVSAPRVERVLQDTPGVQSAAVVATAKDTAIAPCRTLQQIALQVGGCRGGVVDDAVLRFGAPIEVYPQRLMTPAAAERIGLRADGTIAFIRFGGREDAADQIRTALAQIDPYADVQRLSDTFEPAQLRSLRRALLFGATVVLAIIGAALLVAGIEQLRERRRVLAVLAAFGTRRGTMAWSVMWQMELPMVLGLVLAVGSGVLLGGVLLKIADAPLTYDWGAVAALVGAGGAVVAAVTVLSLPVLWRLMQPEALRVE